VIVPIVHLNGIGTCKAKRKPPVLIDPYRPKPIEIAPQRMQPPSGHIHISGTRRAIKAAKLQPKSFGVLGLNASLRAAPEEPFHASMAEASNH
jgi:hypothetical protein